MDKVCTRGGARGAERGAHARTMAKAANLRLGRRVEVVVRVDEPSAVDVPVPGGIDAAPVFVAQSAGPVGRETCRGPSRHVGERVSSAQARACRACRACRAHTFAQTAGSVRSARACLATSRSSSRWSTCAPSAGSLCAADPCARRGYSDTRILFEHFSRIYPAISPLQYGHQGAARGPGAKPAAVRKSVPTPHRATLARPAPAVAADAASVAVAAASKAHDCDFSLSLQARPRKGVQRESAGHRRLRVAAPWRLLMRPRARHRTGRFPHRLWLSGPLARTPRAAGRQAAALTRPAAPVQPTTRHIDYCLHLIGMLQHYGVRPIAVLDGAPLPVRRLQSAGLVPRRRAAAYEPYVLSNIAGGGDGAPWPACWGSPLAHVSDSLDATRARLLCALTGEGRRQRGSFGDRRARS